MNVESTFVCAGRTFLGVFGRAALYLSTLVTPSALDYYLKNYFKLWVVQFLTFVAKQCWPKLCLLARAGTFAWQHYLLVYSGDTDSFWLQNKSSCRGVASVSRGPVLLRPSIKTLEKKQFVHWTVSWVCLTLKKLLTGSRSQPEDLPQNDGHLGGFI